MLARVIREARAGWLTKSR